MLVALGLAACLVPQSAFAATATLETRLGPSYLYDTYPSSYFGQSVDIEGDRIAVGDSLRGAVAVYDRSGGSWSESLLFRGSGLGLSAALSNPDVVAGARPPGPIKVVSSSSGAWDVAGAATLQGMGVATDGDLAVTTASDVIRVYRRGAGSWGLISTMPWSSNPLSVGPPTVAVAGDTFAVADSVASTVRIFTVSGDSVVGQQAIPTQLTYGVFFPALGLSGDTIAMAGNGSVVTFRRTEGVWEHEQDIVASDLSPNSQFGAGGVALDGDTLVVGAHRDVNGEWDDVGSAVVFTRAAGTWTQKFKILSPSLMRMDSGGNWRGPDFGKALALDGDQLVVGAMSETLEDGSWSGAAYVYRLSGLNDANTPSGDNVEVMLPNGIKLIFSHITSPGGSYADALSPRHSGVDSATILPGRYFDIHTDAGFTGPVTVVVPYDPSKVSGDPARLKLRHWNNGIADDITVSVDTVNHTVTGRTSSFSDYWVEEPEGSGIWVLVNAAADLPPLGYALALLGVFVGLLWLRRRAV